LRRDTRISVISILKSRILDSEKIPQGYVIIAAMLFSISTPGSKIFLSDTGPLTVCFLLYLGTITGMGTFFLVTSRYGRQRNITEAPLVLQNLPALAGSAICGSILAPTMLLISLQYISAPEASLLTSFVAVTNTVIAVLFFKEAVSYRIWAAVFIITIGCLSLSFTSNFTMQFTPGILGIMLTCIFWEFETGWNRLLSDRDPVQVQIVKELMATPVLLLGAYISCEPVPDISGIIGGMLLGFLCYSGVPMILYLLGLRHFNLTSRFTFWGQPNLRYHILVSYF